MNYIEIDFSLEPLLPAREVLVAELAELGFESFDEAETGVKAYIQEDQWNESLLENLMTADIEGLQWSWSKHVIEATNWNAEWEKNFEPIVVDDKCLIRAPFHNVNEQYDYVITIEPKMSFGTGHHNTTYLMVSEMLGIDFKNKVVLDMGSGTGVLAILAEQLGAQDVDAIDIDEWAFENAKENMNRNLVSHIQCFQGGAELLSGKKYDVILANINRNILLADMVSYANALITDGVILFSGFYSQDIPLLIEEGRKHGLQEKGNRSKGEWCLLHMIKTK